MGNFTNILVLYEKNMNKNYYSKNNLKRFFCILFLIIILVSLAYITKYSLDIFNTKKQKNLLSKIPVDTNRTLYVEVEDSTKKNENTITPENTQEETINTKTERMLKLEELQTINPEIIGWLEIENTDINYPVLQSSNNSYYMNHNYKKQYSTNGSVFLDKDFNWNPQSSNFLIYGHNMKNNTMFQSLLNYKNKSYYNQHPIIKFTTSIEDANYEIISAFESRVYYKSEKNVFRYYYFVNAQDENEYNQFVANCKKAALYDTNTTATFGEQLLTLSTCSYHTKDGRFAVVAKKVSIN